MHYYQFNIGDYAKHTRHLTNEEDLAYRRMIDHCYLNETPLVDDVKKIARLINMRNCEDEVKNVLDDFFILRGGAWHNSRVEKDLGFYAEKAERARQNGKKGGRPPKGKPPEDKEPKKAKAGKYTFEQIDYEFSEWMFNLIKAVSPSTKANLESWANTIRLMRESDGLEYQKMSDVFVWANIDHFWSNNILCAAKFRKQFAQLETKMRSESGHQTGNAKNNQESANDRSARKLAEWSAQRNGNHQGDEQAGMAMEYGQGVIPHQVD